MTTKSSWRTGQGRLHCRVRAAAGVLAWLAYLAGGSACANSVDIQASKDNTLYQSAIGSLSNGAGAHMFVGRTNQASDSIRRGLVMFDIAANVPSGSTITAVTLHLYLS